jgi:hypothetical protein
MEAKMSTVFPRVYRSFDDFEKVGLRKLDHLYESVDDMMDEMLAADQEEDGRDDEDGILFDEIDDDDEEEEEGY